MALSEFVAIETAYRVLAPLDPAARVRALGWLTGALDAPGLLPENPAAAGGSTPERAASSPRSRSVAAPQTPKRARKAAQKSAAPAAPAGKTRAARKVAAPAQPRTRGAKATKATKTTKTVKAAAGAERAYRKMPPADDVMGAYRQVGTISGLAEHFGVPTHTVQGWARRLRREGHDIGRNS